MGSSKALGINNSRKGSIHAEELAIKYCLSNNKKNNKFKIFIWKFNKGQKIKPAICCSSCTHLAKKYNFTNKIFTIENNVIKCAIVSNPKPSLGDIIRNQNK